MNKWKLLAVQQALFIYVVARLDQGETEHNNIDMLMITTVIVWFTSLYRIQSVLSC